jgi:hypothetical protein
MWKKEFDYSIVGFHPREKSFDFIAFGVIVESFVPLVCALYRSLQRNQCSTAAAATGRVLDQTQQESLYVCVLACNRNKRHGL